jgi:hypothetical protein
VLVQWHSKSANLVLKDTRTEAQKKTLLNSASKEAQEWLNNKTQTKLSYKGHVTFT